jgi:hypothetical protein
MATAREHIEAALRLRDLATRNSKSPNTDVALLHVIADATIAIALALGADLPPLPGLDEYCLCPTELRAETFTHADDCPHSKKSPTDAPAEDSPR